MFTLAARHAIVLMEEVRWTGLRAPHGSRGMWWEGLSVWTYQDMEKFERRVACARWRCNRGAAKMC
jgi:hypothetical protein